MAHSGAQRSDLGKLRKYETAILNKAKPKTEVSKSKQSLEQDIRPNVGEKMQHDL